MKSTKPKPVTWQAVCESCAAVAGTGTTIAELAAFGACGACGQPTKPQRVKSPGRKRHHGGLTRKKYMDPATLLAFRKFMESRAKARGSRRAWTDYVIVEILARTGMRAGELVSAQEHRERYLRIQDVVLDADDPSIFVADGKGSVSRTIRISQDDGEGHPAGWRSMRDILAWYIGEYRKGCPPDAPLITGKEDRVMPYHTLNYYKCKLWSGEYEQETGDTLGLTALTCHVFRHSFSIDFLAKTNNDFRALAEVLGHSDPSVTMRIYAHVTEAKWREYANKM